MKPAPVIPAAQKMTTVLFGMYHKQRTSNHRQSDAKMSDIMEMADDFHSSNPAANDIEKVILFNHPILSESYDQIDLGTSFFRCSSM